MRANKGEFTVKRVTLHANGYDYVTFRVSGRLNGQRIRKDFKSKEEADEEKDRLEIEAANTDGSIPPVNTRLTPAQVLPWCSCLGRRRRRRDLTADITAAEPMRHSRARPFARNQPYDGGAGESPRISEKRSIASWRRRSLTRAPGEGGAWRVHHLDPR